MQMSHESTNSKLKNVKIGFTLIGGGGEGGGQIGAAGLADPVN